MPKKVGVHQKETMPRKRKGDGNTVIAPTTSNKVSPRCTRSTCGGAICSSTTCSTRSTYGGAIGSSTICSIRSTSGGAIGSTRRRSTANPCNSHRLAALAAALHMRTAALQWTGAIVGGMTSRAWRRCNGGGAACRGRWRCNGAGVPAGGAAYEDGGAAAGGAAMERAFLPAALHTRMAALLPAALQWSGRSCRRRCIRGWRRCCRRRCNGAGVPIAGAAMKLALLPPVLHTRTAARQVDDGGAAMERGSCRRRCIQGWWCCNEAGAVVADVAYEDDDATSR
ncbi:hypothetical protein TRIUR3_23200 [Triticum urartu]|uniref:Uncharacterized protein n=1 Tax=Triticum urartu TaxID=4572 RepID=M7Z5G0_TRIUA|nr:hypothetical protein TRIUR3_23200 [Triticum urartu]